MGSGRQGPDTLDDRILHINLFPLQDKIVCDCLGGNHHMTDHEHPTLCSEIEHVVFDLCSARSLGIRMEARERQKCGHDVETGPLRARGYGPRISGLEMARRKARLQKHCGEGIRVDEAPWAVR